VSRWQGALTAAGIVVAVLTAGAAAVYTARSTAQTAARQHRVAVLQEARDAVRDFSDAVDGFLDDREAKGYTDSVPQTWAGLASFERLRDKERALGLALALVGSDTQYDFSAALLNEADHIADIAGGTKLQFGRGAASYFEDDADLYLTWIDMQISELDSSPLWWEPFTNSDGLPTLPPTPTPFPLSTPTPNASGP